jgi:cytidylate kinase
MKRLTIAIDGPSGVGKSTLGKALARQLGYQYIDSGALYRAIGCLALDEGICLDEPAATARNTKGAPGTAQPHSNDRTDTTHPSASRPSVEAAVARLARQADIEIEGDAGHLSVRVNGVDLTDQIRLPASSHAASVVATMPAVREAVVDKLRELSAAGGTVMDGRDIGTKVFPDAEVKLFLDASIEARTQRRWEEERERGRDVSIEEIRSEIEERDTRDRERAATPLVKAADAILIDTSDMPLDRVVKRALEIVQLQR